MQRRLAVITGIVVVVLSAIIMVEAARADLTAFLGQELAWFSPYFRVGGIIVGGVLFGVGLTLIGLGMGRWRRPVREDRR